MQSEVDQNGCRRFASFTFGVVLAVSAALAMVPRAHADGSGTPGGGDDVSFGNPPGTSQESGTSGDGAPGDGPDSGKGAGADGKKAKADAASADLERAVMRVIRDNPEVVLGAIRKNPEVVVEAIREWRDRRRNRRRRERANRIDANREELVSAENDPVAGNEDAAVTVVEFFDYACPYCRKMAGPIERIVESGDARVVFKEFPVLSKASRRAAEVSLVVNRVAPEKWFDFHTDLLREKKPTRSEVTESLKSVGLKPARIRGKTDAAWIDEKIGNNLDLGKRIGVRGTPAFVIGDTFIGGAVGLGRLRKAIGNAGNG